MEKDAGMARVQCQGDVLAEMEMPKPFCSQLRGFLGWPREKWGCGGGDGDLIIAFVLVAGGWDGDGLPWGSFP